jgi:hypothetical protein
MSPSAYRRILITAIVALSCACTDPALKPVEVGFGFKPVRYLLDATLILAGTVDRVERLGWRSEETWPYQHLQLCRITASVAQVLKGGLPSNYATFYSFVFEGSFTGSMPPMRFEPGGTYIFYLNKESGEWRTACDSSGACFDVLRTGRHPDFVRDPNKPPANDILRLLITRGEHVSNGEMVDLLAATRVGYARRWVDYLPETYLALLRETAEKETPPVAAEACALLAELGRPCTPCELAPSKTPDFLPRK